MKKKKTQSEINYEALVRCMNHDCEHCPMMESYCDFIGTKFGYIRLPMRLSRWRISGWKITMMARTPTSRRVFMMTDIIFIPSADTTTCTTSRKISARKMFIAEELRISRIRK